MAGARVDGDMPIVAATDQTLATGADRVTTIGGLAAIAGAVLAVAGNAIVLAAEPSAPADTLSYPLSADEFRIGQVFFALTQALMATGIAVLVRTGIAGRGRPARIGGRLAIIGYAITILGELVLALVADASLDSDGAAVASSVFGVGVLIADVGLILFGIAALRAAVWPRRWAALPIVLGAFQLLIVTPVVLTAGFASLAAFAVIGAQDLIVALLGFRLLAQARPRTGSPTPNP